MKSVLISQFLDSVSEVTVSTVPSPQPNSNELLIKIIAAGVNFVDTLYARGKHQNNRSLVRPPFTLGLEFAGEVVSAPLNSPFQPGDTVFGNKVGSYAEYITVSLSDAGQLDRVPQGWKPTDAAGLGATLPVSYGALLLAGAPKKGATLLVHSATGGLGVMAVQLGVALGYKVLGTAGSPSKCDYAKSYGAADCFDYNDKSWPQHVLKATDGVGVDVIFDPVGLVDLSLKCIAFQGKVLVVGFAGREGNMEKIAMNRVLLKQVSLIGYRYGETLRRDPQEKKRIWSGLGPLIASGQVQPTVSKIYEGLENVPQALHDLSSRKISGKAVIKVSEDETRSRL